MNKENDMICTGGVPPQLIMGMEMYQYYMQGMLNWCQLYSTLTGMDYWTKLFKQAENNQ
jgi:uncharacterized circularly permuted ATP-grasp superfamily protein